MNGLRLVYFLLGWVMMALGIAGAVLPILPTTPFVLAAAWLFCRSSPRMEAWLVNHPYLGAPLRSWQREGAIANRTKLLALVSMAIGYCSAVFGLGLAAIPAFALAAVLLSVATFIVTRPAPTPIALPDSRERA